MKYLLILLFLSGCASKGLYLRAFGEEWSCVKNIERMECININYHSRYNNPNTGKRIPDLWLE